MAKKDQETLVVIPTYNEKDNIKKIIAAVYKYAPRTHILIIDDSSPDGTGTIVRLIKKRQYPRRLFLLSRAKKEGLGKAYIDGFKWALDRRYDYIVSMDADFSHHPKYLPAMLDCAREKKADIVIGSRYIKGGGITGWDWKRQLNSRGANAAARIALGLKPKDVTAGYKIYNAKFLKSLALNKLVSSGYAFQVEMLFLAKEKGAQVYEVPIVFADRRAGTSKIAGELTRSAKIVWRLFLRRRVVGQAMKFMAIGLLNVLVDWGIYYALTRWINLNAIPSRIVSSSIALTSSYIWNRLWTFRGSKQAIAQQFIKFVAVNGMGLVWNNLLFALFINVLGIYDLLALVLTTIIVFFWNFGLTKIWAFKDR